MAVVRAGRSTVEVSHVYVCMYVYVYVCVHVCLSVVVVVGLGGCVILGLRTILLSPVLSDIILTPLVFRWQRGDAGAARTTTATAASSSYTRKVGELHSNHLILVGRLHDLCICF